MKDIVIRGDEIDIERLGFSKAVATKTYNIFKIVSEHKDFIGKAPSVIMAASVYLACILCSEHKSQEVIGKKFDRSHVSVRNTYQNILDSRILVGKIDGITGGEK